MKKNLLTLAMACIFLLLSFCPSFAYDQVKPEDRMQLINNENEFSYVRIKTYGTALGIYWDNRSWEWKIRQGTFKQVGSGFVVKNGYILTAAHVVIPKMAKVVGGKYQTDQRTLFKVLKQIILVYGFSSTPFVATIHHINHELDTAILRCDDGKDILQPLPYPIEYAYDVMFDANKINTDDVVCTVVHNRDEEGGLSMNVHLEYGYVIKPEPTGESNSDIAWLNPLDITLGLKVIPGDSGSPLFAFNQGKPVIIGIVRAASLTKPIGYAVLLPVVDRYLDLP